MSDTPRYTIRFSPDDYLALDALCARWRLKRPDALRRALRSAARQPLNFSHGCFLPIGARQPLPIRVGGTHEST